MALSRYLLKKGGKLIIEEDYLFWVFTSCQLRRERRQLRDKANGEIEGLGIEFLLRLQKEVFLSNGSQRKMQLL